MIFWGCMGKTLFSWKNKVFPKPLSNKTNDWVLKNNKNSYCNIFAVAVVFFYVVFELCSVKVF